MYVDLAKPNWPAMAGISLEDGPTWPQVPYGWFKALAITNQIGFEKHFQLYNDIVEWAEQTVPNHRTNVLWDKVGDCIYLMFRKERDYLMFTLKFGAYDAN